MFGIPTLVTAGGGVIAGLLSMWLWTRAEIHFVEQGARRAERSAGVVTCNARMAEIERTVNHAIDAAVDAARREASTITEAPADLVALCKADPACLSRGSLP